MKYLTIVALLLGACLEPEGASIPDSGASMAQLALLAQVETEPGIITYSPAACAAPAMGLELARTGAAEYQVCARSAHGPVRYVFSGNQNPKPPNTAALGAGQIRLTEMHWTETNAAGVVREWQLLSCGNCDGITAVRSPNTTTWAWTGGGYGLESDLAGIVILVDGAEIALGIGQSVVGGLVDIRQTLTAFAPGAIPILQRHVGMTISVERWQWSAEDLAVADHELGDIYAGRLEGVSLCTGGLWTSYLSEGGQDWTMPHCNPGPPNLYTYPTGAWTELYGPSWAPRLRVTLPVSTGWRAIANLAYDSKLKLYGFTAGYSSPQVLARGDRRHYGFQVELL